MHRGWTLAVRLAAPALAFATIASGPLDSGRTEVVDGVPGISKFAVAIDNGP